MNKHLEDLRQKAPALLDGNFTWKGEYTATELKSFEKWDGEIVHRIAREGARINYTISSDDVTVNLAVPLTEAAELEDALVQEATR